MATGARRRWRPGMLTAFSALTTLAMLAVMSGTALAGAGKAASTNADGTPKVVDTFYANSPAGTWTDWQGTVHNSGTALTKFKDPLPLPCVNTGGTACTAANYIPVAFKDTATYTGSDYYEIAVVEYRQVMHTDLPTNSTTAIMGKTGTKLRGYVQLETAANTANSRHIALQYPNGSPILDLSGNQVYAVDYPRYLGPLIIAAKGTPVRIKYMNLLPVGADGDLFIPVDKTIMGAGTGPDNTTYYTENRIAIHHHGGDTPWISDGTPSQWLIPVNETSKYANGDSFSIVPDMPDPGKGKGAGTLYFTNDISGRLMFYHDHAMGTTRLNVYAGMAAGFLQTDTAERGLTPNLVLAKDEIPLVIQDRTFAPLDVTVQDSRWNTTHWGDPTAGDLWFPNVYEFNQDLTSGDLTNPPGRWDYGPYFWPVFPVAAGYVIPDGTWDTANNRSNATTTPEAFSDTMVVNGVAYPTVTLEPKPYRFRILNAGNDRFLNLGLYEAKRAIDCTAMVSGGTGFAEGDVVTIDGTLDATVPNAQRATATVTKIVGIPKGTPGTGVIETFAMTTFGTYDATFPAGTTTSTAVLPSVGTGATFTCAVSGQTEVAMVPFDLSTPNIPQTGGLIGSGWGTMVGALFPMGVPSPATIGPPIIQIGNEGGLLPDPVTIPSTPVNFEYNKRSVTVLNIFEHGLLLGNAERADVIVDFTGLANKTFILYNDAPAPVPAGDPRIDYYTGNPDFTDSGGAPTTRPGYGPNTRTVMQIKIVGPATGTPQSLATLVTDARNAYKNTQDKPVVAQKAYNNAFGTTYADKFATIRTGSLYVPTFDFIAGSAISFYGYKPNVTPLVLDTVRTNVAEGQLAQMPVQNKAIQELFDPWGRMNATLGVELPFTNGQNQTTVPLNYIDPATERIEDGETQIWKITHNGVDTHPVHFHLVNVQLINRVGWDGTLKVPDANEVGWKETVRMNPLEDVIVAVRAKAPQLPFGVPTSTRNLSPTEPVGSTMSFSNLDPLTGNQFNPPVANQAYNFEWEYVWHCHILGHEENDFMRPFIFKFTSVVPDAPTGVGSTETASPLSVNLTWTDTTPALPLVAGKMQNLGNPKNEIGFKIARCDGPSCTSFVQVGTAIANATAFVDNTPFTVPQNSYKVIAYNAAGETSSSVYSMSIISKMDGVCGTSNGATFTTAPATNLCGVGTVANFTATGTGWTWNCNGYNTGAVNASCTANIQTYVLAFNVGPNGTLTGSTIQTVNYGASATAVSAVATPNSAYRFVSWVNSAGTVVGTLPSFTATNVVSNETYTAIISVPGDFNGDGNADILWTDTSNNNSYVWYMSGTAMQAQPQLPAAPGASWTIVGRGDFNNDGKTDIVYRNQATGQNIIRYMNGVAKISDATIPTIGIWDLVGVGDFDGDGKPDLLWRRASTGQTVIWYMDNTVQKGAALLPVFGAGTDWYIAGVGDFDGDGKPDIIWRRPSTGQNVVWYMNNATQKSAAIMPSFGAGTDWVLAAVNDYDKDGKPDLLWRRPSTGQNVIWYMNNVTQKSAVLLPTKAGTNWKIVGH